VPAFRIVEALNVIEHIGPGVVSGSVHSARRSLGLQRHEKKLSLAALSQTLPERLIEQTTL